MILVFLHFLCILSSTFFPFSHFVDESSVYEEEPKKEEVEDVRYEKCSDEWKGGSFLSREEEEEILLWLVCIKC